MTEQQRSAQVFASHLAQLMNSKETSYQKVSRAEYEQWKKVFTWDALYGQRYSQSFCNHFGITDSILFYDNDYQRADAYIQKTYIY